MSFTENWGILSEIGTAQIEKPNQPISTVLKYIEKYLPKFASENNQLIMDEDSYTEKFCDILNDFACEKPFWFHFQSKEKTTGKSPAIDFAVKTREPVNLESKVYNRRQRFLAFEAKILGVKENYREKEYVIGHFINIKGSKKYITCGGIERFKKNLHAEELSTAGMIGYILKNDAKYWNKSINHWIEDLITTADGELIWSEHDKLKLNSTMHKKVSKYRSQHSRIANTPIKLFHYWVNLK